MCASDAVLQQSSSILDKASQAKKLLITHEDPYHNHKIFGLLSLASFIFRFANVGEDDMGFASYPALTIPTVLVHLMLNVSSFIFKIPKKRISHGGRIWPEYRWHSLIFTLRAHVLILWYIYEHRYNLEPNYEVNFWILMGSMVLADLASWSVGEEYRSNSVRGVDASPIVKFLFSVAQFNGKAGLLFGLRRMTILFLPIFIMQITAFMGTLQRKNLIGYVGLAMYGLLLLNSFAVQRYEYNRAGGNIDYAVRIIGFGAALLRLSPLPRVFRPIQSKYVIWTVSYLVIRATRPHLAEIPVVYFKMTLAGLLAALAVAFYFKRDYYNKLPIANGKKVD